MTTQLPRLETTDRIGLVGDPHGALRDATQALDTLRPADISVVRQLGDLRFPSPRTRWIQELGAIDAHLALAAAHGSAGRLDDVGARRLTDSGCVLRVRTASGSEYEIEDVVSGARLRRHPEQFDAAAEVPSVPLRRGEDRIRIGDCAPIAIGRGMWFLLEPSDDPAQFVSVAERVRTASSIDVDGAL